MTYQNKLPLFYKLCQLLKVLYKIVQNAPREYKYTLGQDALALCWNCLDLVLEVNALKNADKSGRLPALSADFDKLKLRLRLMQELNVISPAQSAHLHENYLKSSGEMIGGWQKWAGKFASGYKPAGMENAGL